MRLWHCLRLAVSRPAARNGIYIWVAHTAGKGRRVPRSDFIRSICRGYWHTMWFQMLARLSSSLTRNRQGLGIVAMLSTWGLLTINYQESVGLHQYGSESILHWFSERECICEIMTHPPECKAVLVGRMLLSPPSSCIYSCLLPV